MWSLRNKQQEVKDYYQATAGKNMWMVWLLSAITFVGTILVVLGLFWAGRWIYQKVTAPDNQPATTETQPNDQSADSSSNGQNQGDQAQNNPDQPSSPTPGSGAAPSTPPAPTPTTTPQTGPNELVRTGPSSDE